MERADPDKNRGELIIRYKGDNPPDPDSAVIEFAKQLVEDGENVTVTVTYLDQEIEVFPFPPED